MIILNICSLAGLRKNHSFLPVPAYLRQKIRLRDAHQYCLILPWVVIYGLLTMLWSMLAVPLMVLICTKYWQWHAIWLIYSDWLYRLYDSGPDVVTISSLVISIVFTLLLPYQLSVVIRCLRLVKKGGQHYVVPEEDIRPAVRGENAISVVSVNSEDNQVTVDKESKLWESA